MVLINGILNSVRRMQLFSVDISDVSLSTRTINRNQRYKYPLQYIACIVLYNNEQIYAVYFEYSLERFATHIYCKLSFLQSAPGAVFVVRKILV